MKLLTKILFIYITLLAVLPCIDNCSNISVEPESYIQIEEHHNDNHNECSPLCNCVYCNTIAPFADKYPIQISLKSKDIQCSTTDQIVPFSLQPASPPPKA